MAITAKITQKGQVTIPRKVREKLNSEIIEFDIVGDTVLIKPVRSVAGSLRAHSDKGPHSFGQVREEAWGEVVKEKYGKKSRRH
jgi:AbrB family looped-hinge helix DNA binding protein